MSGFAQLSAQNALNEAKKYLWTAKQTLKQTDADDLDICRATALSALEHLGECLRGIERSIERYKEEMTK